MLAAVHRTFTEIEADDPVVAHHRFIREPVEHASSDPLVASVSQRRVQHHALAVIAAVVFLRTQVQSQFSNAGSKLSTSGT